MSAWWVLSGAGHVRRETVFIDRKAVAAADESVVVASRTNTFMKGLILAQSERWRRG